MENFQVLKNIFKGRGVFPTVFSIVSWIYLIIIVLFTFTQFLLFVFRIKYIDKNFSDIFKKKLMKLIKLVKHNL